MLPRRSRLTAKKSLERRTPLRTSREKKRRPKDTGPDRSVRDLVLERDSGCVMCGAGPYGLQVHHRKPRKAGGRRTPEANSPSNLISLCSAHHSWVEASRELAYELGLLVKEHENPADVACMHRLYGFAFLLDGGTVRLPASWEGAPQ